MYINDLPECVSSDTGLFANDTLLHRPVSLPNDAVALQADLTSLEEWEEKWNMDLNPSKCEVLHITNKRNPVKSEYHLHGVNLGVTKGPFPHLRSSVAAAQRPQRIINRCGRCAVATLDRRCGNRLNDLVATKINWVNLQRSHSES